jgi:hypothetical protein
MVGIGPECRPDKTGYPLQKANAVPLDGFAGYLLENHSFFKK